MHPIMHKRFWCACAALWVVCTARLGVWLYAETFYSYRNPTSAGFWFALMGFLFVTFAFIDVWRAGTIQRLFRE